MKGRLLIIIFISICFIAGSCNVSSVQGSRYNFSLLDSVIQGWVSKEYYPGASICVVKNDSVIFQKNYGSYTPDTKVYVASAGKWVAAAVIGAVVDSTSLDWDDPVEKWLPEFKGDAKGKILLRQLLSHTSGVRPYLPEPRVDNYNHLDSAIIEILPLDTVFTPGSRFQYGGLAMQIALEATPDNPNKVALLYGPLVLAGERGTEGMQAPAPFSNPALYNDYYTYNFHVPADLRTSLKVDMKHPERTLQRTGKELEFTTEQGDVIRPLYDLHHQRYVVYWDLQS